LTFADKDLDALVTFEQALLVDPSSEVVLTWIGKTRGKMASASFEVALELHANEDYAGALENYAEALEMNPSHQGALRGSDLAKRQSHYRIGLAKDYYVDGVRALSDYWLEQAKSRFGYTRKYIPEHARALNREGKVAGMLAGQRVILGDDYMKSGLYAAARNEYRLAQILNSSTGEVSEKLQSARLEAKAGELLLAAEMFIFKGDFEAALASLTEGEELTERQSEKFELVRAEVDGEQHRLIYERALAFEHDYLYQAAIDIYADLLTRVDYYEDSRARRETLTDYVTNADRLYLEAGSCGDAEEELSLLRQIDIFWPEYLDIQERITKLEKASN
jgi:tetratricopeptide (TPR) repeat protein